MYSMYSIIHQAAAVVVVTFYGIWCSREEHQELRRRLREALPVIRALYAD